MEKKLKETHYDPEKAKSAVNEFLDETLPKLKFFKGSFVGVKIEIKIVGNRYDR